MQTGTSGVALARRYDLELRMPSEQDHDHADVPNVSELSEYKEAAISYIAGYVVKMVVKRISCPECVSALTVSKNTHSHIPFVVFKDNGGFHSFQRMLKVTSGKLPQGPGLSSAIARVVLQECVQANVFESLNDHMFDSSCFNTICLL